LTSSSRQVERISVDVPGSGPILVQLYDHRGRLRTESATEDVTLVRVLAGGFTIMTR
jgi:hypothetical protein